jgi:hypothetical protein
MKTDEMQLYLRAVVVSCLNALKETVMFLNDHLASAKTSLGRDRGRLICFRLFACR